MAGFASLPRLVLSAALLLAGGAFNAMAQEKVGVNSAVNPEAQGTPPGGAARRLVIGQDVVFNERITTTDGGQTQLLFLDQSRGSAIGNLFDRNAGAAVELGEQAHASLVQNRFRDNGALDIDAGCGKGLRGSAHLGPENTFKAPVRERRCVE